MAFNEAKLAMKFAIMVADEVLVPAASFIESGLCARVLSEYPSEIFSTHITLVGSGANFDEFVEEKRLQYRAGQAQGIAYRRSVAEVPFPWRTRLRSATKDIAADWRVNLASGETDAVFRAVHRDLPSGYERAWEDLPDRLGMDAFIIDNVSPLLFGNTEVGLPIQNRLHAIVNRSYFGSYAKDLGAAVFRNMAFLESPGPVPSGNPGSDIDFKGLERACRRQGVLGSIMKSSTPTLLKLRDDPRFAAAYALAHGDDSTGATLAGVPATVAVAVAVAGSGAGRAAQSRKRVLIVTALPREAAAVESMFDAVSPAPGYQGDPNIYREGSFAMPDGTTRHVLLASLPSMGTDNAATVATHAFRTHNDIRFAIMVGIAGGCPNPNNPDDHVRLGDVVVSNDKGVVDYGHVKRTKEGTSYRSSPQRPSASLLGAFNNLISGELLGRRPWQDRITAALANGGLSTRYARPSSDKDVLRGGQGKDTFVIPHPADPDRRADEPKLVGGGVATADILLKDPSLRDEVRDHFNVRAIEMEASGLQTAAWASSRDFIVVRGICDYCDTFKNDVWQHYAALAAASVMRSLIEQMPAEWFS